MSRTAVQRPATLETMTYAYAVRVALRRCRLYLTDPGRDRALALAFPPGAVFESYEVALGKLLKERSLEKVFAITRIVLDKRGNTHAAEAALAVARGEGVIVLVEHGTVIPKEILLAVDQVVDVGPIRPRHLIGAAREAWHMEISPDDAGTLCSYPPELLFAAMRRGRTAKAALQRLAASKVSAKDPWNPLIEDLEGYGPAKRWAQDLARDLAAWRTGELGWRDVDAGLLLSGPPGTGKTLFAKALARSCGANFIGTSSAQWQAKGHLGDMLGAMRRSFNEAAAHAPTILFIDEFDSLGDRRTFRGENSGYSMQVVNALLELLDGADRREGVVVIAASNLPGNIDAALRRPGRLDRHIALELPDRSARQHMLWMYLGDFIELEHLKDIAAATGGYSGADIEQLARDARRSARRAI